MTDFHNNKGQKVGWLENGIYRKKVKDSRHRLKILDAYGIESSIIEKIKNECTEIRILETESDTVYSTSMQNFLDNSMERDFETP